MALYGTPEGIKRLLRPSPDSEFSTDEDARILEAQAIASSLIELETGAVLTGGITPETVLVHSYGATITLWLPKPIRTVTDVTYDAEWDGAAWTGGTVYDPEYYRLDHRKIDGTHWALTALPGYGWNGSYLVTGTWADQTADEPADITYIANYIASTLYKKQNLSPVGMSGPEGAYVQGRDKIKVLQEPEVRAILDKYRATRTPGIVV